LKADEGLFGSGFPSEQISKALEVSQRTIERVRQRCVEESIEAALTRRPRPRSSHQKFDGQKEAHLIAMACSAPDESRRILEKIEWHYTPKHGSWLNMAEIELSVLQRQCL
jgi:hypothetical protein